jgi:hypothetical protein
MIKISKSNKEICEVCGEPKDKCKKRIEKSRQMNACTDD